MRAFGSRGARVGVSTSSGSFVVFLRASAEPCECSAFPRSLSADDPKGIPVTTGSLADFESAAIATEAVAFSAVEGLRMTTRAQSSAIATLPKAHATRRLSE